ncbi:MAG: nickel-responsive transcriptional regulator NikR [Rhodospirillales bacterium]
MQRITITIDDDLAGQFDQLMQRRGYSNRSEAFRDLLRDRIERERLETVTASHCVGCLTYIYDHGERQLPRRLVQTQHAHHDVAMTTLHLHLDHDNCLEAVILRGPTAEVTAFAQAVTAERGVRHGNLWMVPVEVRVGHHAHGGAGEDAPHVHSRPTT